MFSSIIVAVDGSQHSGLAFDAACDLAARYGARLTVVHALLRYASVGNVNDFAERNGFLPEIEADLKELGTAPVVMSPMVGAAASIVVPADLLQKAGELYLTKVEALAKTKDVPQITKRLVDGSPAQAVLGVAADEEADLIVLGSRGFGDVKSFLLGSVSHKVTQEAPCPCLIVK